MKPALRPFHAEMHRTHPAQLLGWLAGLALMGQSCSRPEPDAGLPACEQGGYCRDSDCDFICDADEGAPDRDTDGDGIPDYLDLDSDNDGFSDHLEAGDDDLRTKPFDRDMNGIPDFIDPDYPIPRTMLPGGHGGIGGTGGGVGGSFAGTGGIAGHDPGEEDAGVVDFDGGALVPALCPAEQRVDDGCLPPIVDEWAAGLCNGLDDDCDGVVDEGCPCWPGEVQVCFAGPPGRRNVGACSDGMQICQRVGEFAGAWGPCQGGVRPRSERCDGLDNDCNGCVDEVSGCVATGSCPGPEDPRVPVAAPFSSYPLRGGDFYPGDQAVSWQWQVTGSPCDRMFQSIPGSTARSHNGQLSYRLRGQNRQDAGLEFTLSGAYEVTLTVTLINGDVFTCTWVVLVQAPGIRVELCWDNTGPTADTRGGLVDLDLHMGKFSQTSSWFTANDCYWNGCASGQVHWGYGTSALHHCTGPGASSAWHVLGHCPNPRLDIDSRYTADRYLPENINLDNPRNGDRFRVMVHYRANTQSTAHGEAPDEGDIEPVATHPVVNVYCGGTLHGSFGLTPDRVQNFHSPGQMWRAVDIQAQVSAGRTTGCTLTALSDPEAQGDFWITGFDPTF